jgi:hypothetical protein
MKERNVSWLDRSWPYKNSSTHANPAEFAKRMRARQRAAELQRKAQAAAEIEAAVKVRTIRKSGT